MGDEERFHRHTGSASGVRPRTARLRRLSVPHRASIVDDVPVDVQSVVSDRESVANADEELESDAGDVFAFAPPVLSGAPSDGYSGRLPTPTGRYTPLDVPEEEGDERSSRTGWDTHADISGLERDPHGASGSQWASPRSRGSTMTVPISEDSSSVKGLRLLDGRHGYALSLEPSTDDPYTPGLVGTKRQDDQGSVFHMVPMRSVDGIDEKEGDDSTLAAALPEYTQEEEEEDSPYPEVRAAVSNVDDPSMPTLTIRMWIIALLLSIVGGGANMFFAFRYPSPSLTPVVVMVLAYPLGKLLAAILPIHVFYLPRWLGGFSFTLNPGAFNIKEHTLIAIMLNITIQQAYALNLIVVKDSKAFYGQKETPSFEVIFTLASQILGFGLSGVLRPFLVEPASMLWPQSLLTTTVLNTLHAEEDAGRWGMTRLRWFAFVGLVAFVYNFFPNYIFVALSQFCWMCWIAPRNVPLNVTMGTNGMGMSLLSFDWSEISFISSPMVTPWWAECNMMVMFVLCIWLVAPILYFTNTANMAYFPFASTNAFDNTGHPYNVTRVVKENTLEFNDEEYHRYSQLFLPATYAVSYFAGFACAIAVLVHGLLYHGRSMFNAVRRQRSEPDDVHAKLMRRYRPVPYWWFLLVLVVCLLAILVITQVKYMGLGVGQLLLALCVPLVYALPCGYLFAQSGQMVGTNLISEIIAGYLLPQRPLALILFKTLSVQTMISALSFTADLKVGHYMKIPPRTTFTLQLVGAVVVVLTQIGIKHLMFSTVPSLCMPEQVESGHLSCPHMQVFYTSSLFWGVIGPQRIFSKGSTYAPMLWGLLVGALIPLPFWYLTRRYPNSWFRFINTPVGLLAVTMVPAATGINFSCWFIVAFIFRT